MIRAHKIRLYPTYKQEQKLYATAGACRFVYNWGIDKWNELFKAKKEGLYNGKINQYVLLDFWQKERPEWAVNFSSHAFQHVLTELWRTISHFYTGINKRPKYKKRGCRDAFYCDNEKMRLNNKSVCIIKVGRVKVAESLRLSGHIAHGTVTREGNNWFVTVFVDTNEISISSDAPETTVGIDVGLSHAATTSDGKVLNLQNKLKWLEKKKRHFQHKLDKSKKKKVIRNEKERTEYSNRGKKALYRLRSIQSKINNIRNDVAHKFTTDVCKNHATVVVETLSVTSMLENAPKYLRRSLATSMMGIILRQLGYKAKHIIQAPRFYPSSKTCSNCGAVKEDLTLADRTYHCNHCGLTIDRDLNASLNLMKTPWVTGEEPSEAAQ